jgi:hypothetical protein
VTPSTIPQTPPASIKPVGRQSAADVVVAVVVLDEEVLERDADDVVLLLLHVWIMPVHSP